MANNDEVYTGTVGLRVRAVLKDKGLLYDPAAADVLFMSITLPDGTEMIRTNTTTPPVTVGSTSGLMNGENGVPRPCLEYITEEGELEQAGSYLVQGYVEDDAGRTPAKPFKFKVKASVATLPS